ncbi:MAG: TlpA family protein disulfide reductase [Archangium sp.]
MSDEAAQKKPVDKVTLAFIVLLLGGAAMLGWQQVNGAAIMEEGTPAPDFQVKRLRGEVVSLGELRGKVVVVNFWATWCPPCREEVPYLVSTVQEFEKDGVTLFAISNDNLLTQREMVEVFLQRYPQLAPYAALGRPEIGAAWRVKALPSLFVLDRQGKVVASHQGQATEGQLRRWVKEAISR